MPLLLKRNPFSSSPSTPVGPSVASQAGSSIGENSRQPPPFGPSPAGAPATVLSSPSDLSATQPGPQPQPGSDSIDLEDPPPYTLSASVASGETTVEVGPSRPFQPAQPSANPPRNGLSQVYNQVTPSRIPSSSSLPPPSSSRLTPSEITTSVFRQFTNSISNTVNNLNSPPISQPTTSHYNWGAASVRPTGQSNTLTTHPGHNARSAPPPPSNPTPRNVGLVPPPRHPSSPSGSLHPPSLSTSSISLPSMANHSSDFTRDFYAAGTGNGEVLVTENVFAPPTGPPPPGRQASTTRPALPNDGRPTSHPEPGHPLLKDGKLLVYPKGYECGKCHNVGYKDANPLRPCNSCWNKYAKLFAGPLVYSFSADTASSTPASNFQRHLPHIPPRATPSVPAAFSPPNAYFTPGGYVTNHHSGPRNPPIVLTPPTSLPASGSVTYTAGDPRIGGVLCWKCSGKGNVNMMLFDRETCPLCSGVGRLFH